MRIVYGPVASWRLGRSLGVDLLCSKKKICSFDCIYCQLGKTEQLTSRRSSFVSLDQLEMEIKDALAHASMDVITFSGTGEPTLADNMHHAIKIIREFTDIPLAVLTNSSLLHDKDVQSTLKQLDIIVAKLDASDPQIFQQINQPATEITFEQTFEGIKTMRKIFSGKFALQIMFMRENKKHAPRIAELTEDIQPDEIQINTPLRRCDVKPLLKKELDEIEKHFTGLNTISVYRSSRPMTHPLDKTELIERRRMEP
ncbi:MAG: radical SAM protein [Thermoplasmata archaeon]|nr:MAG: radical SAM protein [Thermoplasmata archaeon]RLF35086.1 MAG: radical SAM protein [Thermoplasmata archaeon]